MFKINNFLLQVQLLSLITCSQTGAQLQTFDDQIPNYSHQNETDDLEPNHIFSVSMQTKLVYLYF